MSIALEDVNLLLSDLDLGVSGHQAEDTFAKSSGLVVQQVETLERALSKPREPGQAVAEWGTSHSGAGIVDVAIARGMPKPAGGPDDPTAR